MSPQNKDVWIDGILYSCIALFSFSLTFLGTDEAAKYVDAAILFWMKYFFGAGAAVSGSLKMFRSSTFAQTRPPSGNGGTQFYTRTDVPPSQPKP